MRLPMCNRLNMSNWWWQCEPKYKKKKKKTRTTWKYLESSFFSLWSCVSSIVFTASSLLLCSSSVVLTFSSWIWQVLSSYQHSNILHEPVITVREHSTHLLTWMVKQKSSYFSKASILILSSFSLFRTVSISFRTDCLCIYTFFSSI